MVEAVNPVTKNVKEGDDCYLKICSTGTAQKQPRDLKDTRKAVL